MRTYFGALGGPLIGLFLLPLAALFTGGYPPLSGLYAKLLNPAGVGELGFFGFFAYLFGLVPSIVTMGVWWWMNGKSGNTWLRLFIIACVGGLTSVIWCIVFTRPTGPGVASSLAIAMWGIGAATAVICALMTLNPVGTEEWQRSGIINRIGLLIGPVAVWGVIVTILGYVQWQHMEYARFQRERIAEAERLIGKETAAEVYALPCRASGSEDFPKQRWTSPALERLEKYRTGLIDPNYPISVSIGSQQLAIPQRYLQRSASMLNCPPSSGGLQFGYWLPDLIPTKTPTSWEPPAGGSPSERVPVFVTLQQLGPSREWDRTEIEIRNWTKDDTLPRAAAGAWQELPHGTYSKTRHYLRSAREKITAECLPSGWCSVYFDMLDYGLRAEIWTWWWSADKPTRVTDSLRTLLRNWNVQAAVGL